MFTVQVGGEDRATQRKVPVEVSEGRVSIWGHMTVEGRAHWRSLFITVGLIL